MVPFTQYVMPEGRARQGGFERPARIEALAAEIIRMGGWFDAEVLSNGVVSLTAEHADEDGETQVLAIEIADNGPPVLDAVDRLVIEAHAVLIGAGA